MPPNHRYRKNRKDFFVGRVENDVAPPRLSDEELLDVVSEYGDIVFGLQSGKQKFLGFGLTHCRGGASAATSSGDGGGSLSCLLL